MYRVRPVTGSPLSEKIQRLEDAQTLALLELEDQQLTERKLILLIRAEPPTRTLMEDKEQHSRGILQEVYLGYLKIEQVVSTEQIQRSTVEWMEMEGRNDIIENKLETQKYTAMKTCRDTERRQALVRIQIENAETRKREVLDKHMHTDLTTLAAPPSPDISDEGEEADFDDHNGEDNCPLCLNELADGIHLNNVHDWFNRYDWSHLLRDDLMNTLAQDKHDEAEHLLSNVQAIVANQQFILRDHHLAQQREALEGVELRQRDKVQHIERRRREDVYSNIQLILEAVQLERLCEIEDDARNDIYDLQEDEWEDILFVRQSSVGITEKNRQRNEIGDRESVRRVELYNNEAHRRGSLIDKLTAKGSRLKKEEDSQNEAFVREIEDTDDEQDDDEEIAVIPNIYPNTIVAMSSAPPPLKYKGQQQQRFPPYSQRSAPSKGQCPICGTALHGKQGCTITWLKGLELYIKTQLEGDNKCTPKQMQAILKRAEDAYNKFAKRQQSNHDNHDGTGTPILSPQSRSRSPVDDTIMAPPPPCLPPPVLFASPVKGRPPPALAQPTTVPNPNSAEAEPVTWGYDRDGNIQKTPITDQTRLDSDNGVQGDNRNVVQAAHSIAANRNRIQQMYTPIDQRLGLGPYRCKIPIHTPRFDADNELKNVVAYEGNLALANRQKNNMEKLHRHQMEHFLYDEDQKRSKICLQEAREWGILEEAKIDRKRKHNIDIEDRMTVQFIGVIVSEERKRKILTVEESSMRTSLKVQEDDELVKAKCAEMNAIVQDNQQQNTTDDHFCHLFEKLIIDESEIRHYITCDEKPLRDDIYNAMIADVTQLSVEETQRGLILKSKQGTGNDRNLGFKVEELERREHHARALIHVEHVSCLRTIRQQLTAAVKQYGSEVEKLWMSLRGELLEEDLMALLPLDAQKEALKLKQMKTLPINVTDEQLLKIREGTQKNKKSKKNMGRGQAAPDDVDWLHKLTMGLRGDGNGGDGDDEEGEEVAPNILPTSIPKNFSSKKRPNDSSQLKNSTTTSTPAAVGGGSTTSPSSPIAQSRHFPPVTVMGNSGADSRQPPPQLPVQAMYVSGMTETVANQKATKATVTNTEVRHRCTLLDGEDCEWWKIICIEVQQRKQILDEQQEAVSVVSSVPSSRPHTAQRTIQIFKNIRELKPMVENGSPPHYPSHPNVLPPALLPTVRNTGSLGHREMGSDSVVPPHSYYPYPPRYVNRQQQQPQLTQGNRAAPNSHITAPISQTYNLEFREDRIRYKMEAEESSTRKWMHQWNISTLQTISQGQAVDVQRDAKTQQCDRVKSYFTSQSPLTGGTGSTTAQPRITQSEAERVLLSRRRDEEELMYLQTKLTDLTVKGNVRLGQPQPPSKRAVPLPSTKYTESTPTSPAAPSPPYHSHHHHHRSTPHNPQLPSPPTARRNEWIGQITSPPTTPPQPLGKQQQGSNNVPSYLAEGRVQSPKALNPLHPTTTPNTTTNVQPPLRPPGPAVRKYNVPSNTSNVSAQGTLQGGQQPTYTLPHPPRTAPPVVAATVVTPRSPPSPPSPIQVVPQYSHSNRKVAEHEVVHTGGVSVPPPPRTITAVLSSSPPIHPIPSHSSPSSNKAQHPSQHMVGNPRNPQRGGGGDVKVKGSMSILTEQAAHYCSTINVNDDDGNLLQMDIHHVQEAVVSYVGSTWSDVCSCCGGAPDDHTAPHHSNQPQPDHKGLTPFDYSWSNVLTKQLMYEMKEMQPHVAGQLVDDVKGIVYKEATKLMDAHFQQAHEDVLQTEIQFRVVCEQEEERERQIFVDEHSTVMQWWEEHIKQREHHEQTLIQDETDARNVLQAKREIQLEEMMIEFDSDYPGVCLKTVIGYEQKLRKLIKSQEEDDRDDLKFELKRKTKKVTLKHNKTNQLPNSTPKQQEALQRYLRNMQLQHDTQRERLCNSENQSRETILHHEWEEYQHLKRQCATLPYIPHRPHPLPPMHPHTHDGACTCPLCGARSTKQQVVDGSQNALKDIFNWVNLLNNQIRTLQQLPAHQKLDISLAQRSVQNVVSTSLKMAQDLNRKKHRKQCHA